VRCSRPPSRLAPSASRRYCPPPHGFPSHLAVTPPGHSTSPAMPPAAPRAPARGDCGARARGVTRSLIPPRSSTRTPSSGPRAGVAERLIRFSRSRGRNPRSPLRLHGEPPRVAPPRSARLESAPPSLLSGTVYRPVPERGGRPREILQVGRRSAGPGRPPPPTSRSAPEIGAGPAAGPQDVQVNLCHVGVLAPGQSRQWTKALRADGAPLDRPQVPRQSSAARLPGHLRPATLTRPALRQRPAGRDGRARRRATVGGTRLEHLLALDAALTADGGRTLSTSGRGARLSTTPACNFEVYVAGTCRAAGAGGRYYYLMDAIRPGPCRVGVSSPRHHRRGAAIPCRVALATKAGCTRPSVRAASGLAGAAPAADSGRRLLIPSSDPASSSSWSSR